MKKIISFMLAILLLTSLFCINISASAETVKIITPTLSGIPAQMLEIKYDIPNSTSGQIIVKKSSNSKLVVSGDGKWVKSSVGTNETLTVYFKDKSGTKKIGNVKVNICDYGKIKDFLKIRKSAAIELDCVKSLTLFDRKINRDDNSKALFKIVAKPSDKSILSNSNKFIDKYKISKYFGKTAFYGNKKGTAYIKLYYQRLNSNRKVIKTVYLGKVKTVVSKSTSTLANQNVTLRPARVRFDKINYLGSSLTAPAFAYNYSQNLKDILYPADTLFDRDSEYENDYEIGYINNYHHSSKYSLKTSNSKIVAIRNNRQIEAVAPGEATVYVYENSKKIGNINVFVNNNFISYADTFEDLEKYYDINETDEHGGYWYANEYDVFGRRYYLLDLYWQGSSANLDNIVKTSLDKLNFKVSDYSVSYVNKFPELYPISKDGTITAKYKYESDEMISELRDLGYNIPNNYFSGSDISYRDFKISTIIKFSDKSTYIMYFDMIPQ